MNTRQRSSSRRSTLPACTSRRKRFSVCTRASCPAVALSRYLFSSPSLQMDSAVSGVVVDAGEGGTSIIPVVLVLAFCNVVGRIRVGTGGENAAAWRSRHFRVHSASSARALRAGAVGGDDGDGAVHQGESVLLLRQSDEGIRSLRRGSVSVPPSRRHDESRTSGFGGGL